MPPLAAHLRFVNDIRDLVDVEMNQKNKLGWIDQNRMQATVDNINKYFKIITKDLVQIAGY